MPNKLSENKLIEELTKLNQDNLEAIKQFGDNYDKVMNHLTQPQIEIATLEKAIKKLSGNYETITKLMKMVDSNIKEAATKTVERINQAVATADHPVKVSEKTAKNAIHEEAKKYLSRLERADAPTLLNDTMSFLRFCGQQCPNGLHKPPCSNRIPVTSTAVHPTAVPHPIE